MRDYWLETCQLVQDMNKKIEISEKQEGTREIDWSVGPHREKQEFKFERSVGSANSCEKIM